MSILKIKSGSGINVNANPSDKSLTIQTEVPLPTSSNPLSVERGGTGVANLDVEIQALKEALVNAINGGNSGIGNVTVIGNEMIFNKKVYITTSGQWTAPKTGVYKFRLGGGGAGSTFNGALMYIGSPGFYEEGFVHLQKNEIVTIQIGAGGNGSSSGGAGGGTSILTTNFSLTALGGKHNYVIILGTSSGYTSGTDAYNSFINLEDVQGLGGKAVITASASTSGLPGKVSIEWFE